MSTVGLSEATIRHISAMKHEPSWMLDIRLEAYHEFVRRPMPNFGPDLSSLDFSTIDYYHPVGEQVADNWDQIPNEIKQTYQEIGLPEAEQRYLAGSQAQTDSTAIYNRLKEEWQSQGVIFTDTDTALRQHPDLFREYFGTVVSSRDNKFAALNTAVWSGGSFIYVPPDVHLTIPLQAYFLIDVSNVGQFERSLIVADRGSTVQYVEGCSAPVFSRNTLHAAVVEVIVKPHARARYTTIQNWSTNVINLTTQRMLVKEEGIGEWIDGNIGSQLTMKYPCLILAERGARGNILSLATAKSGQKQDNGGKAIHLAPDTSSTVVAKSICSGDGSSTYRGEIVIDDQAANARSATKCDTLLLSGDSLSNTYPTSVIKRSDANLSHEATTGRINEWQLFYLMSRGLDEDEATGLIIQGFIEPIISNLPMEYAVELNRLIELSMEGSVG